MKEFTLQPFAKTAFTDHYRLEASAAFHKTTLFLKWTLYGPTNRVLFQVEEENLWKHTCFEFFLKLDRDAYLEWNFAPSGETNTYHFESYRQRAPISGAPFYGAVLNSNGSRTNNRLTHEVELSLELLSAPQSLTNPMGSLTAVLESDKKEISYWAAKHAPNKADFHLQSLFNDLK